MKQRCGFRYFFSTKRVSKYRHIESVVLVWKEKYINWKTVRQKKIELGGNTKVKRGVGRRSGPQYPTLELFQQLYGALRRPCVPEERTKKAVVMARKDSGTTQESSYTRLHKGLTKSSLCDKNMWGYWLGRAEDPTPIALHRVSTACLHPVAELHSIFVNLFWLLIHEQDGLVGGGNMVESV